MPFVLLDSAEPRPYTSAVNRDAPSPRLRAAAVGVVALVSYAVVIGGTAQGELHPILRTINALAGSVLVVLYVWRAPAYADKVDRGVLFALLAFCLAGLLSLFPRQSFDAVVAALVYAAAFFIARDAFRREHLRTVAIRTMMVLSTFFTLVIAARWLPLVIEWWALTDWTVFPPLDLSLSAAPWGHRHDVALLIVLLYPSWWAGRRITPIRAASAVIIGITGLLIVVIDGSRTLWLAMVVATALTVGPPAWRALRSDRRIGNIALAAIALAGLASLVTGLAGTVADRFFTVATLGTRASMWTSLTDLWLEHPLGGVGPGSFPWALQLTDFFDMNTWSPRHPDSLLFQLLPETGLLGIVALGAIAAVLLPTILRSGMSTGRWALVTFAVAGIGANPTDFAFLVAVAIVWAAIVVPHARGGARSAAPALWSRRASLVAAGIVGVAFGATVAAAFSYDGARDLIHRGELDEADDQLTTAMNMDPGLALYPRQRGTLHLVTGAIEGAVKDLEHATALNPADDLAWRTLALARASAGDEREADTALARAIEVQRSDPTNLLLLVHRQVSQGDHEAAADTVAEIVQAWPTIVAAPGWTAIMRDPTSRQEAVDAAIGRWQRGLSSPRPFADQALTLVTLGRRFDLKPEAMELSRISPRLGEAYIAVHLCHPDADQLLKKVSDAGRRSHQYWGLVMTRAAQEGRAHGAALRLYQITTGGRLSADRLNGKLNPVWENNATGFSADTWGYRRPPIFWPDFEPSLPSVSTGSARWILDEHDVETCTT